MSDDNTEPVGPIEIIGATDNGFKSAELMPFSAFALQIRTTLASNGWCYLANFSQGEGDESLIALAHALGHIYTPPYLSPACPLISTQAAADADDSAPLQPAQVYRLAQ